MSYGKEGSRTNKQKKKNKRVFLDLEYFGKTNDKRSVAEITQTTST